MSQQLTPEQQRNIRARFGCDVQSLHDMISFHDNPLTPSDIFMDNYQRLRAEMERAIDRPLPEVSDYDRLRLVMVEALTALDMGAPGVAHEALLRGINDKPRQQETAKVPF
jgi:hypothetical protein